MKLSYQISASVIAAFTFLSCNASATVRYVDASHYLGTNASPPFTNWATAAKDIQDAVDVAVAGDLILVTNGIYGNALRSDLAGVQNHLLVNKTLTVQSVNGPGVTFIFGGTDTRCAYLTSGAVLSGITLTLSYVTSGVYEGAGVFGGTLTNCTLNNNNNWNGGNGGGAARSTLINCVLDSNYASKGGGTYFCTVNNCYLTNNAVFGGTVNNSTLTGGSDIGASAAISCTLNNCILTNNYNGAVDGCTLNRCLLLGNGQGGNNSTFNSCTLANPDGTGGYSCNFNACILTNNWEAAYASTLRGCLLYGNNYGAENSTLNDCTLIGQTNTAAINSALYNCISFYNGQNYDTNCTLNSCCTTPMPTNGTGNITAEPQLADLAHISANSPCRGAGNYSYVHSGDIDGEAFFSPPSIGCDEYRAGAITGPLSVAISATYSNVATGFTIDFTASIAGHAAASSWDFGDSTVVSNRLFVSHSWSAPGNYPVVLRVYNESYPTGVSATLIVRVLDHPVHYVSLTSTNPVAPYLSWATAATNLQVAVDAAYAGGTVVVTNGVYTTDGPWRDPDTGDYYWLIVRKPLRIASVNGPAFTSLNGRGFGVCAYLNYRAVLDGLTLTNGRGGLSGAAYRGTLTNCVLSGNSGQGGSGGARESVLINCTLSGNQIDFGQGAAAWHCRLYGCIISNTIGDGADDSTLINCTISGSSVEGAKSCTLNDCAVSGSGYNGADACTLSNCTITANAAGVNGCQLTNCTLTGNTGSNGATAAFSTLRNCAVTDNQTGVSSSTLWNCTVAGNSQGLLTCNVFNSIVYYNAGGNDYTPSPSHFDNCCTTPLPTYGTNNITNEPLLTDAAHLSANSPCRGAGSADAIGVDLDGQPWASPPSIGCDEFYAGSTTGPLTVTLAAQYTNVAVGFPLDFTSQIGGRAAVNVWDFNDGTFATNHPYGLTHTFAQAGDYTVVLRAYNDSTPASVGATVTIHVIANPVQYVSLNNANPVAPYTSWATAATNLQQAVDAAYAGGQILVSNGVYRTGSRVASGETNRVAISSPVLLRSVNGKQATIIDGGGAMRCVYLANGAALSGFTLTNGFAINGGGVIGGVLTDCLLTRNVASYSGGGAYVATLKNCTLWANSATNYGGGAAGLDSAPCLLNNCSVSANLASAGGGILYGQLNDCTVTYNSAQTGGGTYACSHTNCIVYYNTGANMESVYSCDFSCTTPLPQLGTNNVDAEPRLTDPAHISSDSPCRGAGSAQFVSGVDLDGESWANPPSIGCDEFHTGATGPLSVTVSADYTNVAVGFTVNFTGTILGHATENLWDDGAGNTLSNHLYLPNVHANWAAPGDYAVVLRAFNDTYPAGISAAVTVHVVTQPIHYVALSNRTPATPFTSWATAATNIQVAVDAATVPGTLVLVSNGVYQTGVRVVAGVNNRVAITKPITVQSVNGPAGTIIVGANAARCVYLTNVATLSGFTLTNGAPSYYGSGSGAYGGTLSNCVVIGNPGIGAYASTLFDCTLARNTGGGAAYCILNNCTLTNNSSFNGAGAYSSVLINSFLRSNSASGYGGGVYACFVTNCVLQNNSAYYGGGGAARIDANESCVLDNCILAGNRALNADGGGACRCTLSRCIVTNNTSGQYGGGADSSSLTGCTLANNSAGYGGGGASGSRLTNCVVQNNQAPYGGGAHVGQLFNCFLTANSAGEGGGAFEATLNNCVLTANSASFGGGAAEGWLNNCTLAGNSATNSGGGVYDCLELNNCIVYFNSAPTNANYDLNFDFEEMNYSCTTPMPTNGVGNFTNAPLFVDFIAGNLRLQSNSPCINAGLNDYAPPGPDLDGNARVAGDTVDVGAYEFPSPASRISYAWLLRYGLPTDGTADPADPDHDGVDNYHEWRAGSDPTDALSSPPVITIQPLTHRVVLGDDAFFTVTATGTTPLSYQWRYNETNDISGATNGTLVVSNVQWASADSFSVQVSNIFGTALSSKAILTLDQAPIADASASRLLYISPNGTNATVILDGSRSSDPDGDALHFVWYEAGHPQPMAEGMIAVVTLPVGAHPIQLRTDDGTATRTNTITIEVITSAQAVSRLTATLSTNVSRIQPLAATLRAALASVDRSNPISAVNQLQAFQNQVRAQIAPLDPALAASLIQAAQDIIDSLNGGQPHGRFTSVVRQSNGRVRMQFCADGAATCLVEASTNLANWELIGVAAQRADGQFEFEDTQSAKFAKRFYRVVQP